jgi:ubiquinone/menaquinone biosynthesis C-methylase UbiE
LQDVCAKVAERFQLRVEDVQEVALGTPLQLQAQEPPGGLSVAQLKEALETERDQSASAMPFLLRFALGEFHYGQRATKFLPGQRKRSKQIAAHSTTDASVIQAFDVLAAESQFTSLHQAAGWTDLDDETIWQRYVQDVMDTKLKDGDRLYEAGCGVLAFLLEAKKPCKHVELGGCDGAKKTIELVKKDLCPEFAGNFTVGLLPQAVDPVPDNSWDVVVCNSVFQYFASLDQAEEAVRAFLRVAKRWVIISDICDERAQASTHSRQQDTEWAADLPQYLCFPRSWWDRFGESREHLVSIRHVGVKGYVRRKERYIVYIEKNAE